MEEQTRLEEQEKRLQFENSLRHHSERILRLTAGSVRGMVTFDEMIIHSFESYLETLSELIQAYPRCSDKLLLIEELARIYQASFFSGYEKHITTISKLKNLYSNNTENKNLKSVVDNCDFKSMYPNSLLKKKDKS